MSCGPDCTCGCCAGINLETPMRLRNPPGLDQITYRAGRHGAFMESLKARLSSTEYPALQALTTREPDDASLALMDGLAVSLDVLSFYNERFANQHYLRTATERLSVIEMARLIGYQPAPGVAAATHLAFTLQDLPGAPSDPITIPVGTKVQSVPGQDEEAQVFETVAPAPARAAWNAIPIQRTLPWVPEFGDTELWLEGVATGLEPGDAILLVGDARRSEPGSERWDVRVLRSVEPDLDNGRTRVVWADGLGSTYPPMMPADTGVQVHAFRARASFFGSNAPDPNLLGNDDSNYGHLINTPAAGSWSWKNFGISDTIAIDPQNRKVIANSWVALVSNVTSFGSADLPGYTELYRAKAVAHRSMSGFGVAGKVTEIIPYTTENLNNGTFQRRNALVLCQSEHLPTARTPLAHPVHGDRLTLGRRETDLVPGQPLALTGKRQMIQIGLGVEGLVLLLDDGTATQLSEGDRLAMMAPAETTGANPSTLDGPAFVANTGTSTLLHLRLMDRDGRVGSLVATADSYALSPSNDDDPVVQEIVFVKGTLDAIDLGRDTTQLQLLEAMKNVYERASTVVNANVAPATHGETFEMILGDGDAGTPNQAFALNQSPLTYVAASTPSGRAPTLEVRVEDVAWQEVPSLYKAEPDARAYTAFQTEDATTWTQFGDGIEGARLPSGSTNVRARFRKGLGVGGNVDAGKITTLLSRPLGVAEAVNPSPATGGEDAEPLANARENAPLTTLTLDRAVSIADYENLTRAFAGIDKAHAIWIPHGRARGVFLTIAGVDGAEVPETSKTYNSLNRALRDYGDPLVPIRIVNYVDMPFRLRASVKVLTDFETDPVLADVEVALRAAFAFAARRFGQMVSIDEVAAVAQSVAGVEAVHITHLYRDGTPAAYNPRLFAHLPVATRLGLPKTAELLTLADAPLDLKVLP
ncbi:putative baseplate assembly protein [Ruegeria sp. 2205SS24-7]|uniref:putative baseplate assembly protein n=1 Tax=Ruegeria discodermiae TaxID=3064389 RepID=UPI0027411A82|nr:putative baseplate assembly protein [Ruegeria sp. 2205SS24-7]MDP5220847.1 putative baseplate assembly protein [Ruegeria sp. 2205SS24-7]